MSKRTLTVGLSAAVVVTLTIAPAFSSQAASQPPITIPGISPFSVSPSSPLPDPGWSWSQRALDFDTYAYNYAPASGTPVIYPWGSSYKMPAYYQDPRITAATGQEAATESIIPLASAVSGTLVGVNKASQNGNNFVSMLTTYFHPETGLFEDGVLNDSSGANTSGSWWYSTLPNVLYYMLGNQYTDASAPGLTTRLKSIADQYLQAVNQLRGGTGTTANFTGQGYNYVTDALNTGSRNEGGDGAAGAAVILTWAYSKFGDAGYLQGAEEAMNYLETYPGSAYYEILPLLAPYIAARLNATAGTSYDVTDRINDLLNSNVRDWGTLGLTWNGYEKGGLQGKLSNDGYAYSMNSFAGAFLAPTVKYDPEYANAVGSWLLNLNTSAQNFYPDRLPAANQWYQSQYQTTDQKTIPYEVLSTTSSISPIAEGDLDQKLSVYGGAWAGFMSIMKPTNVANVLQVDLNKLDYFGDPTYPTYLYYNPSATTANVQLPVAGTVGLYDAVSDSLLSSSVSGTATVSIPAGSSRVVVEVPSGSTLTRWDGKTKVGSTVVGWHSGTQDLALGQSVTASSSNSPLVAANVTDRVAGTRWESGAVDTAGIRVDLAQVAPISRVVIDWEAASAKSYEVWVWKDGDTPTKYTTTSGQGGREVIAFPAVQANHVFVYMTQKNNPQWNDYSIYGIHAYTE